MKQDAKGSYAEVNGLHIYYEIHGNGNPLVLIHGGGSTIETTFGRLIPAISKNRKVIAVEMQAHGRTDDRTSPLSFQQDADDIASLLQRLNISKADFLGFSNGGQTLIEIALRHPGCINKLIFASIFYNRDAAAPEFWKGFEAVQLEHMPKQLHEGFLNVNNNPSALLNMFNRDVERMRNFKGWTKEELRSITFPALIINGNNDVGSMEHAVEISRLMPQSTLVIFPGGHGNYIGTIESIEGKDLPKFNAVNLIEEFLDT